MRKYIKSFVFLLCGLSLLTGCEKELMEFEGKDSLYFDVRRGPSHIKPELWGHHYFSTVEFGNLLVDEVDVSYRVMASGTPKNYDRAFTVTINKDSTTAISESDFKGLKKEYVIKAGETNANIAFTVHRTERMDNDTLQLQLQLNKNEHFELNFTNFGDSKAPYDPDQNPLFDYNKNAGIHNIFIYDVLSRPQIWSGNDVSGYGLFGKFSAKKFRLMMEMSNTTIEDYRSKETMPGARQTAIAELMAIHLLEKANAKDPVLDEDETMMWFMPIQNLGGASAWVPFTKPENYYK